MAEGSWIRVSAIKAHLDARTVNAIVKEALGKRAISVTQKPELRKQIGEAFIDVVTKYVPSKTGKLSAQGYATSDGRVIWSATNKRGENYAGYVYDPAETRWPTGEYAEPTTPGTVPRWVEKVQPDTEDWDVFVNNITPLIKEAFNDE